MGWELILILRVEMHQEPEKQNWIRQDFAASVSEGHYLRNIERGLRSWHHGFC
jgi:hypothetical protein